MTFFNVFDYLILQKVNNLVVKRMPYKITIYILFKNIYFINNLCNFRIEGKSIQNWQICYFNDIKPDIYELLTTNHQYEVQSNVSDEIFKSFLDYWLTKKHIHIIIIY